jgi:predicted NBD/HSP70 family sugar kinase
MNSSSRSLLAFNRATLLQAVRTRTGVTRAELVAATGLSRSTVAKVVRELIEQGVVVEGDRTGSGDRGRPAAGLRLTRQTGLIAGLDYGHSHLRAAVATADEAILREAMVTLATDDSPELALRRGAELLVELLEDAGASMGDLQAVGMGLPAPVDSHLGRVSANGVLPSWVDTHPGQTLGDLLGVRVFVDNDANLGARAEHRHGGHDASNLVYVKAASGIGAGLVLSGEVYQSTRGIAGELGHVRVAVGGEICRCGGRGCLETVASAPRILADLQHLHPGLDDVAQLVDLVRSGDPAAARSVSDAGHAIGRVLADMCSVLAPDCVVLGGQLSETGTVLLEAVRQEIEEHAQPAITRDLDIRLSTLQARAEITGALALAADSVALTEDVSWT